MSDIVITTVIAEGNTRKYPVTIDARFNSITTTLIPVPGPGIYRTNMKIEDGHFSLSDGRGQLYLIGRGKPILSYESKEKPTPKNIKNIVDNKYDALATKKLIKTIEEAGSSVNQLQDLEKVILEWFPGNYYGSITDLPGGEIKECLKNVLRGLQKQIIGQFIIFIGKIDEDFLSNRQIRLGTAAIFLFTLEAIPEFIPIALSAITQKRSIIPLTSLILRVKGINKLDTLLCSNIRDKKSQGVYISEILTNKEYPMVSEYYYNKLIEENAQPLEYTPVIKRPSPWSSLVITNTQAKQLKPKAAPQKQAVQPKIRSNNHVNKFEVLQAEEDDSPSSKTKYKKYVPIEMLQKDPNPTPKASALLSVVSKPTFPEPDTFNTAQAIKQELADTLSPVSDNLESDPSSAELVLSEAEFEQTTSESEPAIEQSDASDSTSSIECGSTLSTNAEVVSEDTPGESEPRSDSSEEPSSKEGCSDQRQKKPIGLVGGMIAASAIFAAFATFAAPKLLQMLPNAFARGTQ